MNNKTNTKEEKQVEQIYKYVSQQEDFYYAKLTGGEDVQADIVNSLQAASFQKVRYFIEMLREQEGNN